MKPFCGGRTDASNDQGYSDTLKVRKEYWRQNIRPPPSLQSLQPAQVELGFLRRCGTTKGGGEADGAHSGTLLILVVVILNAIIVVVVDVVLLLEKLFPRL